VFKHCTEEISSEKQLCASKIMLLRHLLTKSCHRIIEQPGVNSLVEDMAVKLLEVLSKRFKATGENKLFAEATMLDPRFKRHGFSDPQSFERVKQSLVSHCEKSKHAHSTLVATVPEVSEKSSRVWDDADKSVSTSVRNPHPRAAGIIEVNKFNDEPLLPRAGNPLTWWLERRQVYVALFELAKRRLCIVATSVPCERVFSKAGQVVIEKRNHLTVKKVAQVLFLNGNL
jgi:hypothetical protein